MSTYKHIQVQIPNLPKKNIFCVHWALLVDCVVLRVQYCNIGVGLPHLLTCLSSDPGSWDPEEAHKHEQRNRSSVQPGVNWQLTVTIIMSKCEMKAAWILSQHFLTGKMSNDIYAHIHTVWVQNFVGLNLAFCSNIKFFEGFNFRGFFMGVITPPFSGLVVWWYLWISEQVMAKENNTRSSSSVVSGWTKVMNFLPSDGMCSCMVSQKFHRDYFLQFGWCPQKPRNLITLGNLYPYGIHTDMTDHITLLHILHTE